MTVALIRPQHDFLGLPHKFRAYVAGYRAGKTWAGSTGLCEHAVEHPRVPLGYYAPTFPLIRDIFYPTIDRVAFDWGLRCVIKESKKEVDLFHGRFYYTTILCRSMENPAKLIGFQVGSALVDEIDTLPITKADAAWKKIIARNSVVFDGLNRIDVTTTPEGFAFTYNQFVRDVRTNPALSEYYGLVQASTYENEANLPDDYIPSLIASYPENLIQAYLHGQFVNLQHGNVYPDFDRELNGSSETVKPGERVNIGMDFNVGKMAGIVCVPRGNEVHAVDEFINCYDTPDIIRRIKERFWKYENGQWQRTREIWVYPDSTGANRTTRGASETDITLLRQAGFIVRAHPSNPPVKDRVNSVCALIRSSNGTRKLFVNIEKAPRLVECLEQQPYDDSGAPDKKNDLDHPPDALGYHICYDYPLRRPVSTINLGVAM